MAAMRVFAWQCGATRTACEKPDLRDFHAAGVELREQPERMVMRASFH